MWLWYISDRVWLNRDVVLRLLCSNWSVRLSFVDATIYTRTVSDKKCLKFEFKMIDSTLSRNTAQVIIFGSFLCSMSLGKAYLLTYRKWKQKEVKSTVKFSLMEYDSQSEEDSD